MSKGNYSKLTKITIAGYKSIAYDFPQEIPIGDINILIGANGSGKSNLISFFRMLNYMMTGTLQTYIGQSGSAENLLHFGSKKTPSINASLEFTNDKNVKDIYNMTLVKTVQDSFIFSEESIKYNGKIYNLNEGHKESFLFTGKAMNKATEIIGCLLSKCRTFQFHDTSVSSNIRTNSFLDNNKYLFGNGGNLASVLYLLKNKEVYEKYYRKIVFYIQNIFPQFDDFVLEPLPLNQNYIKLNWKQKSSLDYILGVDQLSDGIIRFMALAVLLLTPPELLPNIIVIDEPELGLHPRAIEALAAMVNDASRYSQIILATHSEWLLDCLDAKNVITADQDRLHNCSIYKRIDEEALHDWLEEYSLSQLWNKNILRGQP